MKNCISCQKPRRISSFYAHSAMSDGHLNKCKSCCREDATRNRNDRIEERRAYDRGRANKPSRVEARKRYAKTRSGIAAAKRAKAAWAERNRMKRQAHWALNNAVRDCKIFKPVHCDRCNSSFRLEGHHHDYSKPLEVEWLCDTHHKQVHKEEREKRRAKIRPCPPH